MRIGVLLASAAAIAAFLSSASLSGGLSPSGGAATVGSRAQQSPDAPATRVPCGPEHPRSYGKNDYCLIDTLSTSKLGTLYRIWEPIVNEHNYNYTPIKLAPGDQISFFAGGCVQDGGGGDTWKRYVDPSGPNSPTYYRGTVTMQYALDGTDPLQGWTMQRAMAVKSFVIPQPPHGGPKRSYNLTLGYQDTDGDYGNNGYTDHDGGKNDQCEWNGGAPGVQPDGGPAWVLVQVTHGTPTSLPPTPAHPKPFDLAQYGYDFNGERLDPAWGWQTSAAPQKGGSYTAYCGQLPLSPAPSRCSSEPTTFDTMGNGSFFWKKIASWFGPLCEDNQDGANTLGGHLNFSPVTYSDSLAYWDSWSAGKFGDDDNNLNIVTPQAAQGSRGVTPIDANRDGTSPARLHIEFNAGETTANYDLIPWWRDFAGATQGGSALPGGVTGDEWIQANIDDHESVVTGLMGLDSVHDTQSESHPVYALAVRGATPNKVDPSADTWSYFIRNSGNEGTCSSHQEDLSLRTVTLQLPPPRRAAAQSSTDEPTYLPVTGATLLNSASVQVDGTGVPVSFYADDTGAYITVSLPDPGVGGSVAGQLSIKWRPAIPMPTPTQATAQDKNRPAPIQTAKVSTAISPVADGDEPEDYLRQYYNKLTPAERTRYSQIVVPQAAAPPGLIHPVAMVTTPTPPTAAGTRASVRSVYSPRQVQMIGSRLWAFCVVTNGAIPGANVCGKPFSEDPAPVVLKDPSRGVAGGTLPLLRQKPVDLTGRWLMRFERPGISLNYYSVQLSKADNSQCLANNLPLPCYQGLWWNVKAQRYESTFVVAAKDQGSEYSLTGAEPGHQYQGTAPGGQTVPSFSGTADLGPDLGKAVFTLTRNGLPPGVKQPLSAFPGAIDMTSPWVLDFKPLASPENLYTINLQRQPDDYCLAFTAHIPCFDGQWYNISGQPDGGIGFFTLIAKNGQINLDGTDSTAYGQPGSRYSANMPDTSVNRQNLSGAYTLGGKPYATFTFDKATG